MLIEFQNLPHPNTHFRVDDTVYLFGNWVGLGRWRCFRLHSITVDSCWRVIGWRFHAQRHTSSPFVWLLSLKGGSLQAQSLRMVMILVHFGRVFPVLPNAYDRRLSQRVPRTAAADNFRLMKQSRSIKLQGLYMRVLESDFS
jgi:hypothetical protein